MSLPNQLQDGGAEDASERLQIAGERVLTVLEKNYEEYARIGRGLLRRWFSLVNHAHDDVISDASMAICRNAAQIEDAAHKASNFISLEGYVWACFKKRIEWGGYAAAKRGHRHLRIVDASEDYDPRTDGIQPVIREGACAPSQEHVVFLKQVIEKMGWIHPLEKEALRLETEQVNLWEIVSDADIQVGKLMKLARDD